MDGITPTMEIGGGGLGGAGGFGGIIGLLAVLGLVANGGGLFGGNNNATNDALLATALNNRNAIGYEKPCDQCRGTERVRQPELAVTDKRYSQCGDRRYSSDNRCQYSKCHKCYHSYQGR